MALLDVEQATYPIQFRKEMMLTEGTVIKSMHMYSPCHETEPHGSREFHGKENLNRHWPAMDSSRPMLEIQRTSSTDRTWAGHKGGRRSMPGAMLAKELRTWYESKDNRKSMDDGLMMAQQKTTAHSQRVGNSDCFPNMVCEDQKDLLRFLSIPSSFKLQDLLGKSEHMEMSASNEWNSAEGFPLLPFPLNLDETEGKEGASDLFVTQINVKNEIPFEGQGEYFTRQEIADFLSSDEQSLLSQRKQFTTSLPGEDDFSVNTVPSKAYDMKADHPYLSREPGRLAIGRLGFLKDPSSTARTKDEQLLFRTSTTTDRGGTTERTLTERTLTDIPNAGSDLDIMNHNLEFDSSQVWDLNTEENERFVALRNMMQTVREMIPTDYFDGSTMEPVAMEAMSTALTQAQYEEDGSRVSVEMPISRITNSPLQDGTLLSARSSASGCASQETTEDGQPPKVIRQQANMTRLSMAITRSSPDAPQARPVVPLRVQRHQSEAAIPSNLWSDFGEKRDWSIENPRTRHHSAFAGPATNVTMGNLSPTARLGSPHERFSSMAYGGRTHKLVVGSGLSLRTPGKNDAMTTTVTSPHWAGTEEEIAWSSTPTSAFVPESTDMRNAELYSSVRSKIRQLYSYRFVPGPSDRGSSLAPVVPFDFRKSDQLCSPEAQEATGTDSETNSPETRNGHKLGKFWRRIVSRQNKQLQPTNKHNALIVPTSPGRPRFPSEENYQPLSINADPPEIVRGRGLTTPQNRRIRAMRKGSDFDQSRNRLSTMSSRGGTPLPEEGVTSVLVTNEELHAERGSKLKHPQSSASTITRAVGNIKRRYSDVLRKLCWMMPEADS